MTPEEAEKGNLYKTVTEKTLSKTIGQGFFLSKRCYKRVLTRTATAYIFHIAIEIRESRFEPQKVFPQINYTSTQIQHILQINSCS